MIFSLSNAHKVHIGQQFEDSLAIESAVLKYQDAEKIRFSKRNSRSLKSAKDQGF